MAWITDDALIGQMVSIDCGYGSDVLATVLAVSDRTSNIKVVTAGGDVLIGNQWEDC